MEDMHPYLEDQNTGDVGVSCSGEVSHVKITWLTCLGSIKKKMSSGREVQSMKEFPMGSRWFDGRERGGLRGSERLLE